MMGEPIQIISFDETKKLKLNKEKLERILNQEHIKKLPIVIISVVGAYRTGKSFLLSWLIRYLNSNLRDSDWLQQFRDDEPLLQGFKWRSGSKPETQGIWAWSEIFVVSSFSGPQFAVMLIDTQGLFDGNNTIQQNGNIFTLSTLISSTQIFNLSQRIQEDNLGNLELFAEFGRLALTKGQAKNNTAITPFQRIVFLIRDWHYPREHPYGHEGGSEYLEEYLNVTNEREGNELGESRKHIRQCFSDVDCYLMPYPGEKVANDDDDFDGRLSDMGDKFKDHLEKLVPFLICSNDGNIQQKTVAGSQILAGDVTNYVESYVNLLNLDKGLSPESIFETTAKVHNNMVARDALEVYRKNVIKTADSNTEILLLLTDQEISMYHEDFKKKAFEYLEEHQMSNGSDFNSGIMMNQLMSEDVEEMFEHWKRRNELIKAEIMTLNESVLKEAQQMYTTAMDDWFENNINATTPFFSMEQLSEQHQEIEETVKNDRNNHWKGPDVITIPFKIRLQEFMHGQFVNVVVVRNNEKKRQEEDRLELIRVENERAEFQTRMEEEERMRRAVEEEAARQATEAERQRIELEAQMRLQEMNAKHEIEMAQLRAAEAEKRAAAAQASRRGRRGVWFFGKRII